MPDTPPDQDTRLRALAERHGVAPEAARHMLRALEAGGGRMAQFDHPEFGGMGQWSAGGMVMVGRMNDHGLKARVSALCEDLAAALPDLTRPGAAGRASDAWWPDGLGRPSSVGSQNATRYAWFPESRRLAVDTNGRVALYDTGEHVITGASQQQSGTSSFRFSGPHGSIALEDLTPVGQAEAPARPEPATFHVPGPLGIPVPARPVESPRPEAAAAPSPAPSQTDVISTLERLAELHRKGVLTNEEFSGKKAELLARL